MSRELILGRVRTALNRSAGQAAPPPPLPQLTVPDVPVAHRIATFLAAIERLNGKTYLAQSKEDARAYAERLIGGRPAVASNAPYLAECGITGLAGVESGFTDRVELRERCATFPLGITSAQFGLADTGSLVMLSSHEEARLISLLPPVHLAVLPRERLLTGLDELFTLIPLPAERTSGMWFITGPSRTADIEQFLVRGVHGPGEIHVVVV